MGTTGGSDVSNRFDLMEEVPDFCIDDAGITGRTTTNTVVEKRSVSIPTGNRDRGTVPRWWLA